MEKKKKLRTPLRATLTKSINTIEVMYEDPDIQEEDLQAIMDTIELKAEQVKELDRDITEQMVEADATEEELQREFEKITEYEAKVFRCRRKVDTVIRGLYQAKRSESQYDTVVTRPGKSKEKKYKLPKIEFTKFGGEIKEWLPFWAQFQKIHKDEDMPEEDKFQYLRQSTLENSKAREIVDSFPMTAANYQKVIKHLVDRFGNKDTLVEVYVRELLKLVMANVVNPTKKTLIASLYDKMEIQLRALESLEVTRNDFVAILYPLVESCLPEEILRAWERYRIMPINVSGVPIDKLSHLMLFLKGEVESEERICLARNGFCDQVKKSSKKEDKLFEIPTAAGLFTQSSQEKTRKNCIFCKKPHYSNQCQNAKRISLTERQKICEKERACYNCLAKGHLAKECANKSKLKCPNCGEPHCQLMCRNSSNNKTNANLSVTKDANEVQVASTSNLLVAHQEETVLCTFLLRVRNGKKNKIIRAAIDCGTHRTYMVKRLITELGLECIGKERLIHELFGGHQLKKTTHNQYKIEAENLNGLYTCSFEVLQQEKICFDVKRIRKGDWLEKLQEENITLTDVGDGSAEIELLIGNDLAGKLLIDIQRFEEYKNLVAMNYSLGWTIMGKVPITTKADKTLLVHTLLINEANISDLWRLDLIGIEDAAETRKKEKDLEAVTREFKKKLSINQEGRYEVSLPFVNGCPPVKSNRSVAQQRLSSMTNKLHPELRKIYHQIFEDWKDMGIIEEVPENELDNFGFYMPHKPVLNPNSLTTPVRPVFDASAKEKTSLSLNNCLETGPNLLEVITSIMVRFRLWKYGLLADIKKAFLQISIHPSDRDYLRFLWWQKGSNEEIKVYRHKRLVFGLTCSSFILAAIINEILDNVPEKYQETAKQLKNANYVDNCITSVKSEEAVLKFKKEATLLLSAGQFELRGWEWNTQASMENQKKETSVLGLKWDMEKDQLICEINKGENIDKEPITKRIILSITHQIFDPIGFTTPLIILPKMLLQECWSLEIGWKVEVPQEISKPFRKWCKELSMVKTISVPRWIGITESNVSSITLHMFADSSKKAYTAVGFLRVDNGDTIKVQLVQAKTRIAPLKKLSINRLELLGCVISARLSSNIIKDMGLEKVECVYWTDSANALHWITQEDQWGVYVWNRVEEIKKLTSVKNWRHIPGDMNPADLPSRGCNARQLVESSWWEGPDWLKRPEIEWPKSIVEADKEVVEGERRKIVICNWERARVTTDTSWLTNLKFENYAQMVRFVALMKRLVRNRKESKSNKITGTMSMKEIDSAEKHILYSIQNESFVNNDRVLNEMELIQDEEGILKVKTKLLLRDDSDSFKTPIVLPSKHPIVNAIIEYCHKENAHAGTQTVMVLLREKFWIIKARATIKKIINKCFICKWYRAKPFVTPPSQLPLARIKAAAVFEISGVDLTGHLYLEDGSKAWIVLYTCAVYRAISLDLVTSLTTEAFMQSLRRFVADKGRPKTMYSDNGTNLKGTDNCLKKIDWNEIHKHVTAKKIDWIFIPSKAPWWGGWWERLIGIVKDLLKRVLGKSNLNYDEIRTILCEVAAIVNSRPLTYMANDPSELETLTPSMFLKDLREDRVPDLDNINAKKFNDRHQYRVQLKTELRNRFRSEYLSQLVHRKGSTETRPIEMGELVLISNENQKRTMWPIAKVIELIPSKDAIIRVVRVKTSKGVLQRPVKLLIPLEIRPNEDISTLGIPDEYKKEIESVNKSIQPKEMKMKKQTARKKPEERIKETVEEKTTRSGRKVRPVQHFNN